MPVVTTVIPVFNGEKYIEKTLDSLASQTRPPDEVIVLDNCSTDKTREIVGEYRKLNVRLIQNERNLGLFGNMNRALEFAPQTDYLHILTADDLVLPSFFEKLIPLLEHAEAPSIVYSRFELIDSEGRKLPPWWFIDYKDNGAPPREISLIEHLKKHAQMQTILMPASIIKTGREKLPCHFKEDMPQAADVVFYAELGKHCKKIIEVREILCQYRIHPQNTTSRNLQKLEKLSTEEWEAMKFIADLFPYSGFYKFILKNKLRCLYAARMEVCLRNAEKEYKVKLRREIKNRTGFLHWLIGKTAVVLRDFYWKLTGKSHTGPFDSR
jgi:glycosyltransferase involved in cell wall biosynthesis